MTEFVPSPMIHRQFGTPFDVNTGELKPNKRCRASIDEFEECRIEEEEGSGYGDIDQSCHLDFNPEKRIRNNSFTNIGFHVEDTQNECINPEKRSRISSIRQPNFSSHAGFSFNDSSTTILRLEGELRTERQEMQVKEEQLQMACLENKSISDQLKVIETRSTKLNEENVILKRAVNIQEGKIQGLNQHNLQLQQILAQAVQRIAQLENALGTKSPAGDIEPSFDQHMPPDVF